MKLKKASLFAAALAIVTAAAYAAPPYGYTNIYYSDASMSQIVGQSEFTCSGNWYRIGEETDHFVRINENYCRKSGWDLDPWN
ncbi:hypothetical protein [Massilia sp. BKSP1R2A-1]|uniref:hypothetical protein n=1 Tax=Massilia sp. BKSP1R2A-1 TaxID=3422595 RepID=UPI003D32B0A9